MFYCKCAALFRATSVAHGDIVQRHLYVTAPVTDAGRDVSVQSARGETRARRRKRLRERSRFLVDQAGSNSGFLNEGLDENQVTTDQFPKSIFS